MTNTNRARRRQEEEDRLTLGANYFECDHGRTQTVTQFNSDGSEVTFSATCLECGRRWVAEGVEGSVASEWYGPGVACPETPSSTSKSSGSRSPKPISQEEED